MFVTYVSFYTFIIKLYYDTRDLIYFTLFY